VGKWRKKFAETITQLATTSDDDGQYIYAIPSDLTAGLNCRSHKLDDPGGGGGSDNDAPGISIEKSEIVTVSPGRKKSWASP
jgi:hypothetical protein